MSNVVLSSVGEWQASTHALPSLPLLSHICTIADGVHIHTMILIRFLLIACSSATVNPENVIKRVKITIARCKGMSAVGVFFHNGCGSIVLVSQH